MGVEQRITIPTIHIRTPQVTHFLHTFPRFREMHPFPTPIFQASCDFGVRKR